MGAMGSISRFIVRSTTFLRKELATVFRQPRLILTLILGPFLIMLLFGFAFQKTGRSLRTLFVIDPNSPFAQQTEEFAKTIGPAIIYEGIDPDKNDALSKLARNQVDLVCVVPDNPLDILRQNKQVELEMYHNEIDPIQVDYVNQVARLYVDALNKRVLESTTVQNQQEAGSLQQKLQAAQTSAKAYHEALAQHDTAAAATQKQNLSSDLGALRAILGSSDGTNTTSDQNTVNSLDAIIQGLNSSPDLTSTSSPDELTKQEQDAANIEKNISDLNSQLSTFQNMSPGVVSSPFTVTTKSATGIKLELTDFFIPAVIVLLLQHLFVTFAAMSIVGERRAGTMELFKTSPISSSEILFGKTLSFFLFGLVIAATITLLVVFVLGSPMLGTWQNYAIAIVVLLLTSLAVGFFISLVSENDTQAVQFSMLLLLASIFFSGFFLDLRLMWPPMKVFSYILPATYGINIMHDVMLRGLPLPFQYIGGLALIGIILFIADWLILRRMMQTG
jgi:ABC-2 type transport system permease protein